ncbi:MAG: hypothetical protein RR348_05500, partial [Clostridia bacterium]
VTLAESIKWNSYGMYGVSSFAPFLIVLFLMIVCGLIQFAIMHMAKKKGGKSAKGLMVKMVAVPVVAIVGLFGILDIALPPILDKATSSTILYEDVVQDANGQHEKLMACVESFKKKNNLDASVKYTDNEFQNIFKPLFKSMDQAYKAFDPLAIAMALDQPDLLGAITSGKVPINILITLLLETNFDPIGNPNGNNHNIPMDEDFLMTILNLNLDKILDAIAPLLAGEADLTDPAALNEIINKILVTKNISDGNGNFIKWNIFNILGSNMLAPSIDPNAKIVSYHQSASGKDVVTAEMGACLGYQDMAWLDGIPMMFFLPLMAVRNIIYLFAAIIALTMIMQFVLADMYQKKFGEPLTFFKKKDKDKDAKVEAEEAIAVATEKVAEA